MPPLVDTAIYQAAYSGQAPSQLSWDDRTVTGSGQYGLDVSALVTTSGDALVSASATASPFDLHLGPVTVSGDVAAVPISGGSPNVYRVTFTLTFASRSTRQVGIAIVTRADSNVSAPQVDDGVVASNASAARSLIYSMPPFGSNTITAMRWPPRYQGDMLRYWLDVSDWVEDCSDPIVFVSASSTPNDLVCGPVSVTNGRLLSLILGGGAALDHAVTLTMTTASGNVDQQVVNIVTVASDVTLPAAGPIPTGPLSPAYLETQTIGAVTSAITVPIMAASGATAAVRGILVARDVATGDSATWDLSAMITRFNSSGVGLIESIPPAFAEATSMIGCAVGFAVSPSVVTLDVTGLSGKTIGWGANLILASA